MCCLPKTAWPPTYLDGHYALDDICLSVPAVIGRNGVEHVLDIPLNEDESRRLQLSAKTISDYINTLDISNGSLVL